MKKKKTIKINFKYFGGYFDPNDNLFTNLLKKDYNVIIDREQPDYVFYSVYDGKRPIESKTFGKSGRKIEEYFPGLYRLLREIYYFKKERWKMPVLKGNFVKIFYTNENCRPDMGKCDWAFTYEYDEDLKNPRHLRLPSYKFDYAPGYEVIKNKETNIEKIKKEKIKFCNFVYSNSVPFRNKFFKKLNKYKKVESCGTCYNNMGQILPGLRRLMGEDYKPGLNKPKDFLNKFKFTIAFENSSYPGYNTDKILEPMTVNSIPIFWGNPLVQRDFNEKSFLNYHKFEREVKKTIPIILFKIPIINILTKKYMQRITFKKLIKRIIEIDNDDKLYEEYLKQPWYNDNKPSKYVDDKVIRKRLKQIFG
ncbi:hypothetical protein CMI42_00045 [Candidatus Pacearchaeota archaeon]|nr:hypothetical protein [Candidatus Pacearchaeota archaeon]